MEGRVLINMMAVRAAYASLEIDNIYLIETRFNPANGLTKNSPNEAPISIIRRIACHIPFSGFRFRLDCFCHQLLCFRFFG